MRKIVKIRDFKKIINSPIFNDWFNITKKIILSHEFQKRKLMKHHDDTVFEHCILVSFEAYQISLKYDDIDSEICAIAGLLHDFYPEAWQYTKSLEKLDESYRQRFLNNKKLNMHGFVHGKKAMENAYKYYPKIMNKKIANSIKNHMFPLTIIPPRYKEGWIITMADKKVTFTNMPKIYNWPKYLGFNFN